MGSASKPDDVAADADAIAADADDVAADADAGAVVLGDVGGDPACWLHLVCEECGALEDAPNARRCSRCGAPLVARDRD
jgi:hypothetical protein